MTEQVEKTPWEGPTRMTDDELRKFVLDYCDGRIFTSWHVANPQLLKLAFMPLAFGALAELKREDFSKIGCVYEYLEKAGPMAVNGMPTFMSMRLVHVEDWVRAAPAIEREIERRKSIEV